MELNNTIATPLYKQLEEKIRKEKKLILGILLLRCRRKSPGQSGR
mgnify:CR=1 FL=1